jgi:hypothetical protein
MLKSQFSTTEDPSINKKTWCGMLGERFVPSTFRRPRSIQRQSTSSKPYLVIKRSMLAHHNRTCHRRPTLGISINFQDIIEVKSENRNRLQPSIQTQESAEMVAWIMNDHRVGTGANLIGRYVFYQFIISVEKATTK